MGVNPHDALFQAVVSEPVHARGALRAALPVRLVEAIDWDTLELAPSSFVDDELRASHADLVFSARWRPGEGGDGGDGGEGGEGGDGGGDERVCLVFEHQSSSDRAMAFRLVRYIVRIWDRWWVANPDEDELPMVIAVVLYHGGGAWVAPATLEALIKLPRGLRGELEGDAVRFAYHLDDLSAVDDAALIGRELTPLVKLTQLCLKHAREDVDAVVLLDGWREVLAEIVAGPGGPDALALVLRYILLVNVRAEPEAVRALLERAVAPQVKESIMENLMSYGERLIAQGREEGLLRGRAAVLLALLRQRFGAEVDAAVEARVAGASGDALGRWTERVLSAPTLAALLGD